MRLPDTQLRTFNRSFRGTLLCFTLVSCERISARSPRGKYRACWSLVLHVARYPEFAVHQTWFQGLTLNPENPNFPNNIINLSCRTYGGCSYCYGVDLNYRHISEEEYRLCKPCQSLTSLFRYNCRYFSGSNSDWKNVPREQD